MRRIVTSILVLLAMGCGSDWKKAERDARQFSMSLGGSTGHVSCVKKDTDGDGYCSCTAFMQNGEHVSLDCGCEKLCWNCAEGCKMKSPFKGMRPN